MRKSQFQGDVREGGSEGLWSIRKQEGAGGQGQDHIRSPESSENGQKSRWKALKHSKRVQKVG